MIEQKREALEGRIKKKLASFEKAEKKASKSLLEGKSHEEALHIAELVKANFSKLKRGISELHVQDWSQDMKTVCIPLDPTASPKEMLEALFTKSQKLKRSVTALEQYLERLQHEKQKWLAALNRLFIATTEEDLELLQQELFIDKRSNSGSKEGKPQPATASAYRHFFSESGFEILVGKNSASNHSLTFQVARGSDIWLHAHAASGAHVLIKRKNAPQVDHQAMQDALQLAVYFSKGRMQQHSVHEVIVTEKKYVSRLAKAPKGKVMVSKHEIVSVIADKAHVERIKARNHSIK